MAAAAALGDRLVSGLPAALPDDEAAIFLGWFASLVAMRALLQSGRGRVGGVVGVRLVCPQESDAWRCRLCG